MKFLKTNIEKALGAKGMTMHSFAIENKLSYPNFNGALNGHRNLKDEVLELLAKETDVPMAQLKAWQLMDKHPELTDPKFLMYVTQAMENKACG